MESAVLAAPPAPAAGWRAALRDWRENPLYLRLKLARRRQEAGMAKAGRYAPLIIALLPAGIVVTGWLLSGIYWTAIEIEQVVKSTVVMYLVTACIIWFVQGFHAAVLDCMLLLNRSPRKQVSTTLDDLAAVSGLSHHEIAVGTLAAVLPALWLRIFLCAACAMAVYLTYNIDFSGNYDLYLWLTDEKLLALSLALPTVGMVALGGMLTTIALGLYLISLSENYSFTLASATAVLYTMGALAWIPVSVALTFFSYEMTTYGLSGSDESTTWLASQFTAPPMYVLLVWLGLILARATPWLRPVYALGSPWLNPVLLFICWGVSMVAIGLWDTGGLEYLGVSLMVFLYQFGTFAPLSLTHLPTLALLGLEEMDVSTVMLQLTGYAVHLGVLLLLILICARHALIAIAARRQSSLT